MLTNEEATKLAESISKNVWEAHILPREKKMRWFMVVVMALTYSVVILTATTLYYRSLWLKEAQNVPIAKAEDLSKVTENIKSQGVAK